MNSFTLNIGSVFDFTRNHGVSKEASKIEDSLSKVRDDIKKENVSIGKSYTDLHNEITNILESAQIENWDGYGAKAANYQSYEEAERFIHSLPMSIPLPEVALDPDGEFSFEWYRNEEYTFSISIGENELTYAGIFGLSKTHGTEYFGDEIPKIILEYIKRVFSQAK